MGDYERERLARIERNRKILEQLALKYTPMAPNLPEQKKQRKKQTVNLAEKRKSPRQMERRDYDERKKPTTEKRKRRRHDVEEDSKEVYCYGTGKRRKSNRKSHQSSDSEDSEDSQEFLDSEEEEDAFIPFGDSDDDYDPDGKIIVSAKSHNIRTMPNPKPPGLVSDALSRQSERLIEKLKFYPNHEVDESEEERGIKIILTGLKGYNPYDFTDGIFLMGGEVVSDIQSCTHLVSSGLSLRTENLLCGIRFCRYILSLNWLLDSLKNKKFLDEELYMIRDPEAEKKWNFNLKKTLELAKEHKENGIFDLVAFGLTPATDNNGIRNIIELNGGAVIEPGDEVPKNFIYFFTLTVKEDAEYWDKFRYVKDIEKYYVDKEFLFSSLMRQTISIPEFKL